MARAQFDPGILTSEDLQLAYSIVPGMKQLWTGGGFVERLRLPDLVIAPEGVEKPYLYRWYVTPHDQDHGNVYFHIQVDDDPHRPLHDHPWDNQSVILSGGYEEHYMTCPPHGSVVSRMARKGDVIHRLCTEAHRLTLLEGVPYTMTLFSTGPKVRKWGFWTRTGDWVAFDELVDTDQDNVSTWRKDHVQPRQPRRRK